MAGAACRSRPSAAACGTTAAAAASAPCPARRPYDKWNFFELLVDLKTGKIDIAVEGQAYPTYMDRSLGRRKKAPIGLQLHAGSNEVQYKDLALEDNPTVMKLLTAKP